MQPLCSPGAGEAGGFCRASAGMATPAVHRRFTDVAGSAGCVVSTLLPYRLTLFPLRVCHRSLLETKLRREFLESDSYEVFHEIFTLETAVTRVFELKESAFRFSVRKW